MSTTSYYERPPRIEELRAESRGDQYRPAKRNTRRQSARPSIEDCRRLFTIEKGNRWMELARREPEAKQLFGELWHQGELCMLFADTNIGKSVLAVQIGESIARGESIGPFACQAPPARVAYIDFELSKAQFGLRYSKGTEDHEFSDNFFRAQYNFIPDPPPNVDENELLIGAIEYKINQAKATVLIIDNITCLRGGTENSAVALSLMKSLKALKTDHNLSILVLAHTPKRRTETKPISADDLHGSKLLINFADSAFALGKSTVEDDLCYLKQIKQRNTRQRYGHDNVCLWSIQKPGAFLHFRFEGNSPEHHHLLTRTAILRQKLANKIAALAAKGHSQREISNQLGIGLATVNRLLHGCADVQMRECADKEGFENLKMRGFEDELLFDPLPTVGAPDCEVAGVCSPPCSTLANKEITNKESPDAPDCDVAGVCSPPCSTPANEEITNKESPDAPDCEVAGICSPPCSTPANEGITNEESPDTDHTTAQDIQPPPMTNDPMTNDQITNDVMTNDHPPECDRSTSSIDKLLTPELLEQILQTMARKNSILEEESANFKGPNTSVSTAPDVDGP